jgi:pyruvate-formate lyase-activating enzyme
MTEALKAELEELTEFFKTAKIPDEPIKINRYLTLLKPREFPAREIEKLKEFQGLDVVHESLFNHLRELKQTLMDQPAISSL